MRRSSDLRLQNRATGTDLLDRLPGEDGRAEAERLSEYLQRKAAIQGASVNEQKRRFLNFLGRCIWTIDEGRQGVVKPFPAFARGKDQRYWVPIWEDLENAYLTQSKVFVEKSRRVLVSWFTCAFDIWMAAGGQDPRWKDDDGVPLLMQSDINRQIVIVTKREQKFAGAQWFLQKRVVPILRYFEEYGGREWWPDFPQWEAQAGKITFSNGSSIDALPSGEDQARGGGVSWFHMEEVAFWEEAEGTVSAAVQTLQGGGHMGLITTANHGTFAHRLREDMLNRGKGLAVEKAARFNRSYHVLGRKPILPTHMTSDGWVILRLHYGQVPDYNFQAAAEGIPASRRRMEMEIDWTASTAKTVFPEFGPGHISTQKLHFSPRLPLILGWDVGNVPACTPMQLQEDGQLWIFKGIAGNEDEKIGIHAFGCRVEEMLVREFCEPYGLKIEDLDLWHYGDPAGNSPVPPPRGSTSDRLEQKSHYAILKDGDDVIAGIDPHTGAAIVQHLPGWGWEVQSGDVRVSVRLDAVKNRLNRMLHGKPMLLVSSDAEAIITGFQSGYRYPQRQDGTYHDRPEKNWYSHIMDSIQYPITRLGDIVTKEGRMEDPDAEENHYGTEFVSLAHMRR